MIYMGTDYSEGACPRVLDALVRTNMEQSEGYCDDSHCANARELVKKFIGRPDADVHFMIGGTSANVTAIAAALRPFEAVISPASGHICMHESGAVEGTGHKIIHVQTENGKLSAEQIKKAVDFHEDEHFVKPRLVYITQPTELGTLYSLKELREISEVCRENRLYLYLDGARLSAGLSCRDCDMTVHDIAELTDMFYIGGTKMGMLFGEALVILNDALKPDFRFMIKHCCGMLAKGRLLGVQFEAMFEDELYFELGRHANEMAERLREGIREIPYEFVPETQTNQLFIKMTHAEVAELSKHCVFENSGAIGEDCRCVRFCTSWATKAEDVDALIGVLKDIKAGKAVASI